ncbi:activator of basal transcription 1 [Ctenopharyngodon idella]|uniref:activator of basal transcription 1 n=1 Tax=Ctenopharyngodon idella TaxID=7959 RepID=UPI00222E8E88|nr:activator of basal transcription 1 [Ctenopharyngodon idella]XP_051759391.1 activator of basal transcription 1 [Ctenopharyngodon idella]XP_051759392.1 activator of basal transcription 1 [Ctenopharyngodon idella]
MALLEKNDVTTDLETQAMASEEELNDPKPEEGENANGVQHADQEMNCEDAYDDDDGGLELETYEEDELDKPKTKKLIPGIVYIGHIPPRLRPKHMRNMLSVYGEIGRIFLQPEDRCVKMKKKKAGSRSSSFTEGWVEFRDKRIAKRVAASLHNTPMANRKRSRFSGDLWSIKYLHRFHWCHLSERLAYERTVYQQRMRTEISQAKKETNFYLASVEKSQNLEKLKKKKEKKGEVIEEKTWDYKQRPTEEEIHLKRFKNKGMSKKNLQKAQEKSKTIQDKAQSNISLLAKIFSSGKAQD